MKKFVEKKIEDVPLSINFGSETPLTRKPECYRKYPMIELGEVCDIQKGTSITKAKVTEGKTPVIAGGQQPAYYHNESNCEGKTITVSASGAYAGFVNYFDCPIFVSDCTTIKTKDESNLLTDFIFYLLKAKQAEIYKLQSGAAQPHVYGRDLAKIKAPLPPLPEQKAIAKVLSDTDDLIQAIEKKIAKKQLIKKGVMQKLLTPRKEWSEKKLGDIGSFSKGQGIKKDQSNSGDIPCIRYGEIYTRHHDYIKKFYSFISKDIAKTSKRIRQGDILFAGSGETKEDIGKSVAFMQDIEAYAGGDIIIYTPNNVNSLFLGYLLNDFKIQKQKSNRGQGDAVVHISALQLDKIEIFIPPLPEQKAIAEVLSDIDKQLETLQKKLNKYTKIKQSLMQSFLTGEIRLV